MHQIELCELGWNPFFEQQRSQRSRENSLPARVSAHHGSRLLLLAVNGEFSIPVQLADSVPDVAIGDWLLLDAENNRVIQRLERQSLLHRKASGEELKPQVIAANIDTVFIVSSCNEDFNLSRIERYLLLVLQAGIQPIVVLTKADLCKGVNDLRRQTEQLHPGLLVETMDGRDSDQTGVLRSWCQTGQTIALLGSSGVGKSTLANSLGASGQATGAIREKDGKGRHVTTARSLHLLSSGGVLVDNPGMRELQLPGCEDGVASLFDDLIQIAQNCRFRNCNHAGDVGCALAAAVELGEISERRFANFMKLNAEQAHNSRSLATRRERDRANGKMYKSIITEKRRQRRK